MHTVRQRAPFDVDIKRKSKFPHLIHPIFAHRRSTNSSIATMFSPTILSPTIVSEPSPLVSQALGASSTLAPWRSSFLRSVPKPSPTIVASSAAELAPKWDSRFAGPVPHNTDYYLKCMVGGILSCGLTHAGITPLDVTKVC